MSADVIERLRAADPARAVDPAPPEALLAQLRATPRGKPRRSRRRALVLVPIAAAIATGAVLIPGAKTDLAARAYAQTAPAGDRILYVRTTIDTRTRTPTIDDATHAVTERWQRGEQWHQRTAIDGHVYAEVRGADGVLRFSDDITGTPDGELKQHIDRRAPGFVEEFRRRYQRGTLDESGTTTFNGRPARKYVVGKERTRREYFIDAETGLPLGSVERFAILTPAPGKPVKGQRPNGTFTATTTVKALEQLPATPENLAKLTR